MLEYYKGGVVLEGSKLTFLKFYEEQRSSRAVVL